MKVKSKTRNFKSAIHGGSNSANLALETTATQKKVNLNQRKINKHLHVGMPKVPLTKLSRRKEPEKLEDWNDAS